MKKIAVVSAIFESISGAKIIIIARFIRTIFRSINEDLDNQICLENNVLTVSRHVGVFFTLNAQKRATTMAENK